MVMKTYFITLSRLFPKGHRKEGEKTFFKEQLQNALLADAGVSACDCCKYETRDCGACGHEASGFHKKLHTIRANYDLWAKRFADVERGEACISVREWADKPYRSKQFEIARLTKEDGVGIQKLTCEKIIKETSYMADDIHCATKVDLANNDGLSLNDWLYWFKDYNYKEPMAIIHFTKFRY